MARPSPYSLELRRRTVRMVAEVRPDYDTEWAAMKAVASKFGIGTTETLRQWVRQGQIDVGTRPGTKRGVGQTEAAEEGERQAQAGEKDPYVVWHAGTGLRRTS
ncbi:MULTISPECIES: transposase [unclassified Streptomyces]|uniref:transposase n=1 Tax=unclassified Streptomyces TaxID=2593676 RepID=UPI000F787658|nr:MULTISPECIES: transposase [unclassified Streptomyces]RST25012.1 transposase [Streptomyces sp. WAC04770]